MQLSLVSIGCLGMAILLLILSELMIRGLIRRLESPSEFYSDRKKSFSFRIFIRGALFWELSVLLLYAFAGFFLILGLPILQDYDSIPAWILIFIGFIRTGRLRDDIQRMYSRVKRTMKWEDIKLYRYLIETENSNFMYIIDSSLRLKDLERTTKHAKRTIIFDPKTMERIVSKDEITSRLRSHLEFLLSDESSVEYTIEEIYVILFMLSEKARFKEFAEEILSNLDSLQSSEN